MHRSFRYAAAATAGGFLVLAVGTAMGRRQATAAPVVARYDVAGAHGQCRAVPLRLAVVGDLHVSAATTPPAAVARLVAQVDALRPDYVLLVGDYLGHGWPRDPASIARALAPLARLRARVGVAAVLGNNDWEDGAEPIAAALSALGVHMVRNDAWVTPDMAVLGIEEIISNTANPVLAQERYAAILARERRPAPPFEVWLAHQPVIFDRVATTGDMLFAGHTHGGQLLPAITVPVGRWVVRMQRMLGSTGGWPAEEYVRGLYRGPAGRMIVTSGVGTSGPPLRLGVPPEIVLVRLGACD